MEAGDLRSALLTCDRESRQLGSILLHCAGHPDTQLSLARSHRSVSSSNIPAVRPPVATPGPVRPKTDGPALGPLGLSVCSPSLVVGGHGVALLESSDFDRRLRHRQKRGDRLASPIGFKARGRVLQHVAALLPAGGHHRQHPQVVTESRSIQAGYPHAEKERSHSFRSRAFVAGANSG